DRVSDSSGYVGLDDKNYDDPKHRTNREILGKACPTPALVETSKGLVEVVAQKDVAPILKEKLPQARTTKTTADVAEQSRERERKARLETNIRQAIFEAIAT